jgi:hypothetical protein
MNDFLTIKQAADKMGVTPQYVYKQLNNKFKPYLLIVKGKKCLNKSILEEYEKEVEQPFNNNSININQELSTTLETLNKTIDMLTNQLQIKDNQIENLTKLIDQQQQLQLIYAPKKLKKLDKLIEQQEKKGIFQRLFKK